MLKIFNYYTDKIEDFIPINKDIVNIYLCGPTVYDYLHVGNGRNHVILSSLVNFLTNTGYKVNYISNITDIDDKIVNKSKKLNISEEILTERFINEFEYDYKLLELTDKVKRIKVSNVIDNIVDDIEYMISHGFAYSNRGSVFFNTDKIKSYLSLSKQSREHLLLGEKNLTMHKKNNFDFMLWKTKNEGIVWKSVLGSGRPGWHTECFSIIKKLIGGPVDIHAGGIDLKFPHHENENAHAKAFGWKFISKYWLWNGMVEDINDLKISKSLENTIKLRDIVKKFGSCAVKYWYLSTHYRQPLKYDSTVLKKVERIVSKMIDSYINAKSMLYLNNIQYEWVSNIVSENKKKFLYAYAHDLNTPNALEQYHWLIKQINISQKNNNFELLSTYLATLEYIDNILGIGITNRKGKQLSKDDIALYNKWLDYKKENKYQKADLIRNQFREMKGITLY